MIYPAKIDNILFQRNMSRFSFTTKIPLDRSIKLLNIHTPHKELQTQILLYFFVIFCGLAKCGRRHPDVIEMKPSMTEN